MKSSKSEKSSLRQFMPYLKKYKVSIIFALILGLLVALASVYMTYEIGHAIDQMIGKGQVNFHSLTNILFIFLGLVIIVSLGQLLIQTIANNISYKVVEDLRDESFKHLNKLPLSYYDSHSHGDIISCFSNDMDNISYALMSLLGQLFLGLSTVILVLIIMLKASLILSMVVLLSTPLMFFVSWWVGYSSQKTFNRQQKLVGSMSSFVSEMVGNQKLVIAFNQEKKNNVKFDTLNQELYVEGQKAQFISSLTNPVSRFIDHLVYIAIGLVGAYILLRTNHNMTIGLISSFTIYSTQFSKPFIEITGLLTPIQTALSGLDRVFNLLNQKEESPDQSLPQLEEVQGHITFDSVSFSYKSDQPLIKDLNLDVKPASQVAIVGKTGAGKSTLVNLLMRFYDVDKGAILVDGIDIRQVTRDSLRIKFGMVLQDAWLFDGTIRDNLTYGNEKASDAEIYQVLRKSYMYDFVMRLPKKLDSYIGNQGIQLSEGQKQLLTIARAMLSHPSMLILDEATSSVDSLTELKIQSAFLDMMKGKTSFIIAHKLSTIKSSDIILVMEDGDIVEFGNHEDLLAKKGKYYELYKAQFSK
jgi:ABC-type multidrug transport system, ATPase and permease components